MNSYARKYSTRIRQESSARERDRKMPVKKNRNQSDFEILLADDFEMPPLHVSRGIILCHGHAYDKSYEYLPKDIEWVMVDNRKSAQPDVIADIKYQPHLEQLGLESWNAIAIIFCPISAGEKGLEFFKGIRSLLKMGGYLYYYQQPKYPGQQLKKYEEVIEAGFEEAPEATQNINLWFIINGFQKVSTDEA